jgi:hypothetical protein
LGCLSAIPDFNRRIRAKTGIAFYQVIVKIRKTYAITSDLTYSSIRIIVIAGKTSARLFG